jgi:cardiolipin synthase
MGVYVSRIGIQTLAAQQPLELLVERGARVARDTGRLLDLALRFYRDFYEDSRGHSRRGAVRTRRLDQDNKDRPVRLKRFSIILLSVTATIAGGLFVINISSGLSKLNNRTHRKLLVVDGKIGFTGGVGIADEWDGNAQDPDHWRDTHFRIEGPAVAQMQAAFIDNWVKVTGIVLDGPDYLPAESGVGHDLAQVFKSSREGGSESMQLMYLLSTVSATRSIDLAMAYFVPDDLSETALVEAMKRGVKLRMILPGPYTDTEVLRQASHAKWGRLLQGGAEIYEFQPTMFHCKVMVVDGLWSSVGSTNFDNRSFRLNDEANLNVFSAEFAERQTAIFNEDLKRSRRVTYEEWQNRPWMEKLSERAEALLNSQL